MDMALLRNLGVNEAIIRALEKCYGEEFEELEILQNKHDLRLLFKKNGLQNNKPHVLTIPGYFKDHGNRETAEQDNAFLVERYNCHDVLEFLPQSAATTENLKINGVGVRLSDAHLKLLRYLAHKLVDTSTGWVYIQDMRSEGVIPSDGYQPFSRLRGVVAGYLLKKNARDFIEANGRKQYRLSVNPRNIKFPAKGKA